MRTTESESLARRQAAIGSILSAAQHAVQQEQPAQAACIKDHQDLTKASK